MPLEIEVKARVRDLHGLRTLIESIAPYVRTVKQTDTILDYADGRLKKGGRAMRVRELETIHGRGKGSAKTVITLKGKRKDDGKGVKRREETEEEVPQGAREVLPAAAEMGLHPKLSYEKIREDYGRGELKICIDFFPRHAHLGHFVEIEAPSEREVKAVAKELGITAKDIVKETYPEIIGKLVAARTRG